MSGRHGSPRSAYAVWRNGAHLDAPPPRRILAGVQRNKMTGLSHKSWLWYEGPHKEGPEQYVCNLAVKPSYFCVVCLLRGLVSIPRRFLRIVTVFGKQVWIAGIRMNKLGVMTELLARPLLRSSQPCRAPTLNLKQWVSEIHWKFTEFQSM